MKSSAENNDNEVYRFLLERGFDWYLQPQLEVLDLKFSFIFSVLAVCVPREGIQIQAIFLLRGI